MIGKKLRELLKENNMKQIELAEKLQLSKQAISNYINDIRDPDLLTLKKIAKFFDVTTDELLEDIEEVDYEFRYEHNGTKLYHKEKIKK